MTEDEAREVMRALLGARRYAMLEQYAELLADGALTQNLVAPSTLPTTWTRHILDSGQLVTLAPAAEDGVWLDIGSGAGLPGLVVAIASDWRVALVEPRKLRVAFLRECISRLGLAARVAVLPTKVEAAQLTKPASVISARAVASLPALLTAAQHVAKRDTIWLLPKGRSATSEVEAARKMWQGVFHVEQSIVDPQSGIVVARHVEPRR